MKSSSANNFFENNYYNSYYYANIVTNILSRDADTIGFISDFFSCDEAILNLAPPFQKYSAFHKFIQDMIAEFFYYDMNIEDERNFNYYKMNKVELGPLYAESAFRDNKVDSYSFSEFIEDKSPIEYSDIENYHDELTLTGYLEQLFEKIGKEVFYLMYNNRSALLSFNYIVAEHMDISTAEIEDEKIRSLFNNKGFLKRKPIPEWCKNAVFFRDRGRCCLCTTDLSKLSGITPGQIHYDHIVPLSLGGLNDVSNIQLLCSSCNLNKGKRKITTSIYYQNWY